MRIGLFGGSFNPVHYGHLLLAEEAKKTFALQKIIFIPANMSPHKQKEKKLPANHRFRMVELAIKEHPFFSISNVEIRRKGPSFTIDTVRILRKRYPGARFFLLIGSDCLKGFGRWKESEKLRRVCQVVVAYRPGSPLGSLPNRFHRLKNTPLGISSKEIRERISRGKPVVYRLPEPVARYIQKNRLYR